MGMDFDVNEVLTDEHKARIGDALQYKLLQAVENIEISELRQMLYERISEDLEEVDLTEELDWNRINRTITDKITEAFD